VSQQAELCVFRAQLRLRTFYFIKKEVKKMAEFLIFIGVIVYIFINAIGASLMRNIAIEKGYGDNCHAWAACFWLGIFGYLYVVAMPDKIQQSQNQQILEALKEGR
jgi:hypothetical protein